MADLTQEQKNALEIAHRLVDAGVPIFCASPNTLTGDFLYPADWQQKQPSHAAVDRWRPGMALCAVMGVACDGLDVDPRNGGEASAGTLLTNDQWPSSYGTALTPSGGTHHLIARTHLAKGSPAKGIDLQAGDDQGQGRGFLFIAPTERPSKDPASLGQVKAYTWIIEPDLAQLSADEQAGNDPAHAALVALMTAKRAGSVRVAAGTRTASDSDTDAFWDEVEDAWTPESAQREVELQLQRVESEREAVNSTLGGAARFIGRFVPALWTEDEAAAMLQDALARGGYHSDSWNVAHGKGWTAATVIGAGLANGMAEAVEVAVPTVAGPEVSVPPGSVILATPPGQVPSLRIGSAAEMAYYLQNQLGAGPLAGFFRRGGEVVHTPRVDEAGYVEPKDDRDDNGAVQVHPISGEVLASKLQFLFRCYRVAKDKQTQKEIEQPAMFPTSAAKAVVNAPEALPMLRPLLGVTSTPMVRADGTILNRPGYDPDSGYLFLPAPGTNVPQVPEEPEGADVARGVALLDEMLAGFPWETPEDRANYLGLLLTPLMRLITPPSYKMFGINAHQPGSGKSLLADIARIIHGGIFRSELPTDEKEMKSMTTSLLATTSATVVQVDNVTGVVRSPYLAGLLTSDGEMQERELGKSSNLTFSNDRVWVLTGNNLSLGGDLVRRTIVITIDPDMASPESREFAIADLKAWTHAHRNELLWALMVLIRHWVAAGRPVPARKQSDSFAAWETAVGGILATAGIAGTFDAESGKRAAAGGDDDGLADLLGKLHGRFTDRPWTVSEALSAPADQFVEESREWLPSAVLDKLARSEAAGKKSFGHWLRNRVGRWVPGDDGHALVIRSCGKDGNKNGLWKVERRA